MSLGVTKDEFLDSTPVDMKPYDKMHELMQKRKDEEMWRQGFYNMVATMVAVEKALGGKKSKAEYLKEPVLATVAKEKQEEELSEDKIKKMREQLLMRLQVMQINFESEKDSKE